MSAGAYERLLADASDVAGMSREEILSDLAETRDAIDAANQLVEALYGRRLLLFQTARALVPPVTQKVLAEIAGVTETAVISALRRQQ